MGLGRAAATTRRRRRGLSAVAIAAIFIGLFAAVVARPSTRAAAAPNGTTKTVPLNGTFTSTGQPLFDPTAATVPTDITDPLFDSQWDQRTNFGGVDNPCRSPVDLGFDCAFGGQFAASTSGEIGMFSTLHNMSGGTADVSYPVNVDLTAPADSSFAAGDTVTVSSSAPTIGAASITTAYPNFDAVSLDGKFGFHASANATVCVFTCFINNASILDVNYPSSGIASGELFGVLGPAIQATGSYCFTSADNSTLGLTTYSPAPGDPAVHSNCGSNGYIAFPKPPLTSSTSAGTVSASGSDAYAVVPTNAINWAFNLAGAGLPNGFPSLNDDLGSGATIGYNLVQQSFTSIVTQHQDLSFAASGVNVTLDLPPATAYTVKDGGGATVSTGTGPATFPAGDKVSFVVPSKMSVTPSLSLTGNTFKNHTYDEVVSRGNLQALSFNFSTPKYSIDVAGVSVTLWPGTSVNFGPVVNVPTGSTTTTQDLFNGSWTLAGFSPVTLPAFSLTPDPPPTGTATTIDPGEGTPFSGQVASFQDPDPNDAATLASSDWDGSIDWGDGTPIDTGAAVTLAGDNSNFTVSGSHTYTGAGPYTLTATVTDKDTVGVSGSVGQTVSPLTITTTSLPDATYGVPYPPQTLDTSGGVGHLTWAIDSGSLPPGLNLSPAFGTISGQPTAVGTYSFVVRTTDQFGPPATTAMTLSVNVLTAHLTITASSPTTTYGLGTPPITPSYTGLVNGDPAPATLPTCSVSPTLRNGKPIAGTYTTSCSGASDPNYTISYVGGTLRVNKALLTVTADDQSRVFGAPNPTLTATPSGFVNGDDASVLSGAAALSTVGIATPVGDYAITVSLGLLSAHDYDFKFVNGTLSITPDATSTSVIANPDPSTFGTPVTLTATVAPVSPGTITPNGTVQFSRGGNILGPPVPLLAGAASLPITSLISGQTITATYVPADANFTGSSGTVSPTVACAANRTVTGAIHGNLDLTGAGGWCVNGATVTGRLAIGRGVSALIMNSNIGGSLTGNGLVNVSICGTTTEGAVNISNAKGFVLIGDPGDDGCAANSIGGSVNLTRNRHGVEMAQNTVGGALTTKFNGGAGPFLEDSAPEIENNSVSGAVNLN